MPLMTILESLQGFKKKNLAFLDDYYHNIVEVVIDKRIKYPISDVMNYKKLSKKHLQYSLALSVSCCEPSCFGKAEKSPQWLEAMAREIEALKRNDTWNVTYLPHNKKPIGCKWVYKIKYKANGSLERYKAHLVAKDYNQRDGVDYLETFSPLSKLTTVRTLLVVAAKKDWFLKQLDVDNAFLLEDLNEDLYMTMPPSMNTHKKGHVCKLKKSLYRLKQSNRQWFAKLSSFLQTIGFTQSSANHSLFTRGNESKFTVLLIYVDDIILAGNSSCDIQEITTCLDKKFRVKDLGNLKYFLTLEVARSHKGIHICQKKYALNILSHSGLLAFKSTITPMVKDTKCFFEIEAEPYDIVSYQKVIGKLLYLTNTRPDITYAMQFLSQFTKSPTVHHYKTTQ